MRVIKLSKFDVANGKGIGLVVWCAGCTHHCPGCHNRATWNPDQGTRLTPDLIDEIMHFMSYKHINRITFSGGDPLHPNNIDGVAYLARLVKSKYPDKKVWVYTGYSWETVQDLELWHYVDVVVDGMFIESQKDISLPFCGSRNQRVIDVPQTLQNRKVVEFT